MSTADILARARAQLQKQAAKTTNVVETYEAPQVPKTVAAPPKLAPVPGKRTYWCALRNYRLVLVDGSVVEFKGHVLVNPSPAAESVLRELIRHYPAKFKKLDEV